MVLWGAIVGFVLGALLPRHPTFGLALLGAVMGAVAGVYFRNAVRAEVRKMLEAATATPAVAKTAAAASAVSSQPAPEAPAGGFADTQPVPAAPPPVATPRPPPEPVLLAALRKLSAAAPPVEFPNRAAPTADSEAQPSASPPGSSLDLDAVFRRARDWLLGGNTVVRTGVLVLFVGLAFLARYAVEQALLPPQLRLAAIAAAGIALFAFGFRLHRQRPDRGGYALTLQGAGAAVLYLTVFAAFRLYQFLPAGAAFGALAVICALSAFIAVAQNTQAMAFIGFAGAFAAPLLVSTGQGSHVALFSYYLLLGVAIALLAWKKAWRALNLLGFFATFGIATFWGVLQYRPEQFATTEPFLVAFFLVYLAASLAYATRHALAARRAVDATLVFGTPIVAFGLQAALVRGIEYATAFSALALGALYLALGWWMVRAARGSADAERATVRRWLAESFVALGAGFATLAVPLALDGRWTAAVWAVEGAGVFWMGRRQERALARAAGLALQVLAGLAFLESDARSLASHWPVANPRFIGSAMLAGAAFAIAYWSRGPVTGAPAAARQGAFAFDERRLAPVLFWVGFVWWQYALAGEIHRAPPDAQGIRVAAIEPLLRLHLTMLGWVGSAFALHLLALPRRARPWPVAATPAWTVVPFMLLMALVEWALHPGPFRAWGWLAWPLALVLHAVMLRGLDGGPPQRWWSWVHAGGVWLVVLLGGLALESAVDEAGLWRTAWAAVVMLVAGTLVLLLLARQAWFDAAREGGPWPLARFGRSYLWRAALPLAALVALGALAVAVHSDGDAWPLPYVPLLNPAELAVALALAACVLWLHRIRRCDLELPPWSRERHWVLVPAAIGFIAINTVWLRIVHHQAGIAWDGRALFDSFLVQAGYSVLWTLIALALMVGAHRRGERAPWMAGATLLGITVLKLFVIDLSNRGGSERIFVFIAVGLLMLVVGYFAPVPPATRRDPEPVLQEART